MANRPRRPKSNISPSQPATGSTAETARGVQAGEETRSSEDSLASPASDQFVEGAVDAPPADSTDISTPKSASALPPPEEQPGTSEATIAQQASGEDVRSENHEHSASKDGEPSATEIFAADEGLTGDPDRSPRRHLGEFEDDETLPAAEPDAAAPLGVTDAYRDADARAPDARAVETTPPPRATGFGPLLGAAVAGAVLALLGSALLSSAGLMPGADRAGADQFASVGALEAVSSELDTLRAGVEQLQSAQAAGGTGTSYATATDLAALSDRLAAAEQAVQGDGGAAEGEALQAAQAAQESASTSQQTADAAQALAGETGTRLDGFEERFAALEESNRQAGIALSAAGLKAAIDRGGPFMPELESFATATGGGEAVEGLRQFAAEGVPTQGALVAEWPQIEADIRRAIVQPDSGAAVGDQILAGLSSLVTVRSTGDDAAEGGEAGAVLARMTAAIEDGELEAWASEWQALDPAAQAASQAFADRVEARRQAASVVDEALTGATGAVPGTEG